jgi:hypothetical protein
VPLSDREAAGLLDLQLPSSGRAASSHFAGVIERMNKLRSDELDHQIGSWGSADQSDLDAMNALVSGPRLKEFHPYLVRAVAKAPLQSDFMVASCDGGFTVLTFFDLDAPAAISLMPDRSALVLFLDHAPDTAWLGWGGSSPGMP